MKIRFAMLLVASVTFVGCQSPEATRTRGGGRGGDPGNRPANVKIHEGSRPYWKTPVLIPSESVSLEASRQAQRLSQP
jgi:hypothetical protein